jgi:hypothetical protein
MEMNPNSTQANEEVLNQVFAVVTQRAEEQGYTSQDAYPFCLGYTQSMLQSLAQKHPEILVTLAQWYLKPQ